MGPRSAHILLLSAVKSGEVNRTDLAIATQLQSGGLYQPGDDSPLGHWGRTCGTRRRRRGRDLACDAASRRPLRC